MSYGAFSALYSRDYKENDLYEYYFFAEDDYVPLIPTFDTIFLGYFKDNIGFVCGKYSNNHTQPHASIFWGLIKNGVLEKICLKYGNLVQIEDSSYGSAERVGQIGLSQKIEEVGYGIFDISQFYGLNFAVNSEHVIKLNSNCPLLGFPLQQLDIEKEELK